MKKRISLEGTVAEAERSQCMKELVEPSLVEYGTQWPDLTLLIMTPYLEIEDNKTFLFHFLWS